MGWDTLASVTADRDATVVLHTPLFYDVPSRAIHCPMVRARVGGVRTNLIVDTGATDHVLTLDIVGRAGLQRVEGPPGTDASGSLIESWTVQDASIDVDGLLLPSSEAVAIAGPAPFADWGVGGFISPQSLWPHGTVILDFVTNELSIVGATLDSVVANLVPRHPEFTLVNAKRHVSGTLGVEVSIPPHDPVIAIFDSGAAKTEAVLPKDGTDTVHSRSVGGTAMEGRALHSQTLLAGPAHILLESLSVVQHVAVPQGSANDEVPGALLGMDLLEETVLLISNTDKLVTWMVPPEHRG